MIQRDILEIWDLADQEELGSLTPASEPLLSSSYEESSLSSSQLTTVIHMINLNEVK